MSLRELRVLVTHLPPDCATGRTLRGNHWVDREYLLADLVDNVRFLRAEFAYSKGAKPTKPKPIPRPKVRQQPVEVIHQQVAAAAHQHVLDLVLPPQPPDGPIDLPDGG
jgi:hypothetical protein